MQRPPSSSTNIPRRAFLRRSAAASGAFLLLRDSHLAFGYSANESLSVAAIGIGGQGRGDIDNVANVGATIVGLCDVDLARAGDTFQRYPAARPYRDFRRMFDEMGRSIDAVIVATPDHTHAVASIAAMRRGKHVYCEKPLTRTVREARAMRETAAKAKVVTQMGNQGSATERLRRAVELAQGGVLGEIREAHVWFDGGNGPMTRPKELKPVPERLDWDLWLGPAAERPYDPAYLPANWRAWRAFGSGIVGDFGCHTGNIMFRALRLADLWTYPEGSKPGPVVIRVEAQPSERNDEGYPTSMKAVVDLPARGDLPPVKLTFYAKERPEAAVMLGYPMQGWGDLLVGSKGSLYSDCPWNTRFVLLPEARFDGFKGGPPETLPRSPGHHKEWVDACKGKGRAFSGFEVGGPLTELLQLVNVATLVEGPLEFETITGCVLNSKQADEMLHRDYRKGWNL